MHGKKTFKELLGASQKFGISNRFMHVYEKNKGFRAAFGCIIGLFLWANLLVIYPGKRLFLQIQAKQLAAKTSVQLHYLSNFYLESSYFDVNKSWESSLDNCVYYLRKFKNDVVFI